MSLSGLVVVGRHKGLCAIVSSLIYAERINNLRLKERLARLFLPLNKSIMLMSGVGVASWLWTGTKACVALFLR